MKKNLQSTSHSCLRVIALFCAILFAFCVAPTTLTAQTPSNPPTTGNSHIDPATLEVLLPYGQCETMVTFSDTMFKTESDYTEGTHYKVIKPANIVWGEGEYTVVWQIDNLKNPSQSFTLEQTVKVIFPCGEGYSVTLDGYDYKTVRIGCDCWLAENLRNEHYADGIEIPNTHYYQNDPTLLTKYGRLYDWNATIRADEDGQPALNANG